MYQTLKSKIWDYEENIRETPQYKTGAEKKTRAAKAKLSKWNVSNSEAFAQ